MDLGSDEDDDDDDETFTDSTSERLFEFDSSGKEKRNLLPPLGRRLVPGVGCYFESGDRKVKNLVGKTAVSVEDACWALEACRGDVTEAWTCISIARRMMLNDKRFEGLETLDDDDEDDDFDEDDYEIEMEEAFKETKRIRLEEDAARYRKEGWDMRGKKGKDQAWLPKQNPRPINDEPWFTG